MKEGFWFSDWFAGIAITLAFFLLAGLGAFQGLERTAYDWGVRSASGIPSDNIVVIAIDDASIDRIGRWPWPRNVHAELLNTLAKAKPKVIGNTIFYLEPQLDPGMLHIEALLETYERSSLPEYLVAADGANPPQHVKDINRIIEGLIDASSALDTDRHLASSIEASGNVVLAMPFLSGTPQGNPDAELPDYVLANALTNVSDRIGALDNDWLPPATIRAFSPIPAIGSRAAGIGHLNSVPDVDGAIRTEPLVLQYYDRYFPSLALLLAAKSLNLGVDDIRLALGEGVTLGNLRIRTDTDLQVRTFFYSDNKLRAAFGVDSFHDVISGKFPVDRYRDKIVLIGATATGVGAPQVTPISSSMPPVLTLAHAVSSILNEDFFIQPSWGLWVELLVVLLVATYLITLLPRMKAGAAAGFTAVLVIALLTAHFIVMTQQGMWLQLMFPLALLLGGHLLLTTKRFLVTERGKIKSEAESAESNKMLGLAFQGQGQLDMAFEKFRRVPMDRAVMELLYNLALDYERKRQFNKAASVYQYMADFNPKFRDLEQRLNKSKALEQTVMLGGAGGTTASGTLIISGSDVQKPMLGRYQVEKELGKGAMGVVYLGKDPKISRLVAIKTMALSQEFDADELQAVKDRFFREAETAGRLSHPNIVTIYDAGEEHDLAYIAMEFLKGQDLTRYCKPDHLLPIRTVLKLVGKCADALAYAHNLNVVHRDIKPANIMFDPASGELKITDFGIARITDSSKTKTGMVLGTPSYMSPEQLAGQKVDGRSDLFSLGVMLYQMLTGRLPFQADSVATLMYKIANETQPAVTEFRPELTPCVENLVNKALTKNVEQRFQDGHELALALRACLQSM